MSCQKSHCPHRKTRKRRAVWARWINRFCMHGKFSKNDTNVLLSCQDLDIIYIIITRAAERNRKFRQSQLLAGGDTQALRGMNGLKELSPRRTSYADWYRFMILVSVEFMMSFTFLGTSTSNPFPSLSPICPSCLRAVSWAWGKRFFGAVLWASQHVQGLVVLCDALGSDFFPIFQRRAPGRPAAEPRRADAVRLPGGPPLFGGQANAACPRF